MFRTFNYVNDFLSFSGFNCEFVSNKWRPEKFLFVFGFYFCYSFSPTLVLTHIEIAYVYNCTWACYRWLVSYTCLPPESNLVMSRKEKQSNWWFTHACTRCITCWVLGNKYIIWLYCISLRNKNVLTYLTETWTGLLFRLVVLKTLLVLPKLVRPRWAIELVRF